MVANNFSIYETYLLFIYFERIINMKKYVRFLSVIMVLLLFTSLCVISASAMRAPIRYGDVYCDTKNDPFAEAKINIIDATYVQRHVAQLSEIEEHYVEAADVDGDAYITVIDATYIQQYVAKIIDRFPAGYSYHIDKELTGITPDYMSGKAMVGVPVEFSIDGFAYPAPSTTQFYINGELIGTSTDDDPVFTYTFTETGVYNLYVTMVDKWGISAGSYSMPYEVVEKTTDSENIYIKNITYGPPHSLSPRLEVEVANAVGDCTYDFYIYNNYRLEEDKVIIMEQLQSTYNVMHTYYENFDYNEEYIFHVIATDSEGNKAEATYIFTYAPLPIG